jgi:hypothetical protein
MKLSLLSICLGTSQAFFISMPPVHKGTLLTAYDPRAMQNYDDAYVTEAQHVSDSGGVDSAVMERAVMMAYDMMKKKKLELNETVGDTHAAEQQYAMMVQATQDLVTQYKEDVSLCLLYKKGTPLISQYMY